MGQDHRGIPWFSNGKQVYYYDGYRFNTLPAGAKTKTAYINRIVTAGDSLYFIEQNAVYAIAGDSLQPSWLSSLSANSIDLRWHRHTWWWLETDGLYQLVNGKKVKEIGLSRGLVIKNNLQHLYVWNDSMLLTFEPEKDLHIFNLSSKKCFSHPVALRDLTLTPDKKIFGLVTGKGLVSLRTSDGGKTLQQEIKVSYPVQPGKLLSLTADHRSRCWFIQPGRSLVCLDSTRIIREYDDASGLPGGSIKRIFIDREDNLWAYGISALYKISNSPYTVYTRKEGLSPGSYNSLLYDNSTKKVFLSRASGIDQLDASGRITGYPFTGIESDRSFLVSVDSLTLKAVKGNRLLTFSHQATKPLQLLNAMPVFPEGIFGYPFPVQYQGRLYTATDAGIYSASNGSYTAETGKESVRFIALIQDSFLLAGRLQAGLILYKFQQQPDGKGLVPADSLFSFPGSKQAIEKIRCIYVDEKNRAWIGTRTDGIFSCAIKNGKLQLLNRNKPSAAFNNPIVWYIFRNADKRLLALTSDEVYELSEGANGISVKKFTGFGLSGHIEYVSWDDRSYWLLSGEALWNTPFSGTNSATPCKAFFTSVANGSRISLFPAGGAVFHFAHNNNAFEVKYSCDYFINEKQVQYRRRINGGEWSPYVFSHSLSLFGLAPGRYRIEVMALLPDGRETTPVLLQIVIAPPFYKRGWFILLCLLLAGALFYFLYRNKLMRIRHEEKIRNKIARDLHDDIGSTLSGINLSSKAAIQKAATDTATTVAVLQKISDRTETLMEAMSDIVWSINPQHDRVDDMLVRMKEYAAEILEARQMSYRFYMDEKLSHRKLDLAVRKEIFLLFKEAVNNAAKHSGCKQVQITLEQQSRFLRLRIEDDGKGFVLNMEGNGNGLKNMKERARQTGGELVIQSEPGKGTSVEFRLPIT